jgi:hypothetical protein
LLHSTRHFYTVSRNTHLERSKYITYIKISINIICYVHLRTQLKIKYMLNVRDYDEISVENEQQHIFGTLHKGRHKERSYSLLRRQRRQHNTILHSTSSLPSL